MVFCIASDMASANAESMAIRLVVGTPRSDNNAIIYAMYKNAFIATL